MEGLDLWKPALPLLGDTFPTAKIIAVGRKSEIFLRTMGIVLTGSVRHPVNGSAVAFAAEISNLY